MGIVNPIAYEEALAEAARIDNLLVCRGKPDGSDYTAVGYYALEKGGMWFRVIEVERKKKELCMEAENLG